MLYPFYQCDIFEHLKIFYLINRSVDLGKNSEKWWTSTEQELQNQDRKEKLFQAGATGPGEVSVVENE